MILLLLAISATSVKVEASAQEMNRANLSVNPSLLTIIPGHTADAVVSITSTVDDDFTLYATGLPLRVGVRFDPATLHVAANQTRVSNLTVTAGLQSDPGNFTLTVGASGRNVVGASDISVTLVPSADLVLHRIWTEPAAPRIGDQVSFYANIGNEGSGPAFDFRLDFVLDGAPTPFDSLHVSQLGVGQQLELVSANTWSGEVGNHTLSVEVDPENQVAELDESNNLLTLPILIGLQYYLVNLVIEPSLKVPAKLVVDSTESGTVTGGKSYSLHFASGTGHDVEVASIIVADEGTRYITSDYMRHFDSGETWRLTYHKQFLLETSANVLIGSECLLSEWHEAGEEISLASIRICQNYPIGDAPHNGPKFEFASMKIDGQSLSRPLLMDSAHEINLTYSTLYYLEVLSDYGTIGCDSNNWHVSGSYVNWCVTPREIEAPGLLGSLGLTLKADPPNDTLTLDKPVSINVKWQTDYTPLVLNLFFVSVVLSVIGWLVTKGLDKAQRRWKAFFILSVFALPLDWAVWQSLVYVMTLLVALILVGVAMFAFTLRTRDENTRDC